MTDVVQYSAMNSLRGRSPSKPQTPRGGRLRFRKWFPTFLASCCAAVLCTQTAFAQSVGLPAPRLLTTMPMGGTPGSQVEITITGEHLDDADQLAFSDHRINAIRKLNAAGQPEPGNYIVAIAADCPTGLYEARVMTRLGISSSRVFSIGSLPELTQTKANTTLATEIGRAHV